MSKPSEKYLSKMQWMKSYSKLFQQEQPSSAIADSFPGMETLSMPVQSNYQAAPKESVQLKKPPKWLRRPCGANFGFGGK